MKHVPVATFKDRVSEFVSEAERGEEVVITRHGKEAARLIPPAIDKDVLRREAVEKMQQFGEKYLAKYGPTSPEQISQWIDEDRK
jgi:prevent-host-death family protein